MRLLTSIRRRARKEYPEAQLRDCSRTEKLPLASARWVHRTPFPEPLVTRAVLPRAARVFLSTLHSDHQIQCHHAWWTGCVEGGFLCSAAALFAITVGVSACGLAADGCTACARCAAPLAPCAPAVPCVPAISLPLCIAAFVLLMRAVPGSCPPRRATGVS